MLTAPHLKDVLRRLPVETPIVDIHSEGSNLVAAVTSPSYTGVDEAERQAQVWGFLREQLPDADLLSIEFVSTNAPGEHRTHAA